MYRLISVPRADGLMEQLVILFYFFRPTNGMLRAPTTLQPSHSWGLSFFKIKFLCFQDLFFEFPPDLPPLFFGYSLAAYRGYIYITGNNTTMHNSVCPYYGRYLESSKFCPVFSFKMARGRGGLGTRMATCRGGEEDQGRGWQHAAGA